MKSLFKNFRAKTETSSISSLRHLQAILKRQPLGLLMRRFGWLGGSLAFGVNLLGYIPSAVAIPTPISNTPFERYDGSIDYTVTSKSLSSTTASCPIAASGTSTLTVPAGVTIKKAYLYWSGSGTNLGASPTNTGSATGGIDNQVTFQGPSGGATTVTAIQTWEDQGAFTLGSSYKTYYYGARADVTSLVTGSGNYTIGGIRSLPANSIGPTTYCGAIAQTAGWVLVVIYEKTGLPNKTLALYEGFKILTPGGGLATVNLSGFKASSNSVVSQTTPIVWQGDNSLVGDTLSINGTSFGDNNVFNGSGTGQAAGSEHAVDADIFNISSFVPPGSSSLSLSFGTTANDLLVLQALVIGLTTNPDISGKVWDDVNGSANGTFTGINDGTEVGSNAGSLNAILVDSAGKVIASTPVNGDGTYTLKNIIPGQTDVTIRLATSAGTVGSAAPVASLPANWINTSPLTTNTFTTSTFALTGKDFGIEQLPTAVGATATSQVNPGGTTSVAVPSTVFTSSTDPDGTVASYKITAFPTNATSITINGTNYTTTNFPAGGVTVLLAQLNTFQVDPIDGTVTVGILFQAIDNAGKTSSNTATANVPFTAAPVSISGTVFDDADGSKIQNSPEVVTNAGGLNAVLIDSSNKVVATTAVAANGTYTFPNVPPNATYTVQITTATATAGATPPAITLPKSWVSTGENLNGIPDATVDGKTTVVVTTSNVTGVNFGIKQNQNQTIDATPSATSCPVQGGALLGNNIFTAYDNGTFGSENGSATQSPATNPYSGITGGTYAQYKSRLSTNNSQPPLFGQYSFVANIVVARNRFQHEPVTDPVYGATGRFFATDPDINSIPALGVDLNGLIANEFYEISFWAANSEPSGKPNQIKVFIDGQAVYSTGPLPAVTSGVAWKKHTFTFTNGPKTSMRLDIKSTEAGTGGLDFYLDNIETRRCNFAIDYGDAPSSYGDALHTTIPPSPKLYLGSVAPDSETTTLLGGDAGVGADGDDSDGIDDEDAFTTLPTIPATGTYDLSNIPVHNTSGQNATLHAWVDFNQNGKFEAGEYQSTTVNNNATTANLSWTIPGSITGGKTYARFRLTSNSLSDDTATTDIDERSKDAVIAGEVEDYPVAIASNPNVLLVKRITKINSNTTTKDGDNLAVYKDEDANPYDDNNITVTNPNPPTTPADTKNWPNPNTFLIGGINGGNVRPGDELEYTIYYLSGGDSEAKSVLVCDRIPGNVSFIPNSFNNQASRATGGLQNADRGIQWLKNGNTESLTNVQDGDVAQYFPPGIEPSTIYPGIDCDGDKNLTLLNTNGAVVVNLQDLPNATGSGTPNTSYGFIRFRGRVK